jgi:ribosomal protein L44E
MPQHYTKATLQVSVWCNRCGKHTMHRVDDGRRGPCLDCIQKREKAMRAQLEMLKEPEAVQMDLFDV